LRIFIFICAALIALTGCSNKNSDNKKTAYGDRKIVNVKNTTNKPERYKSDLRAADHLAKLATDIPNVKDATAVVIGPYAVVGIDVNAKLDRSRVESIKYTVAESLKHDPHGANAVVVADVDTYQRLKQMGNQIRKGHPEGVMEELAAIIGRVMPQVPKDMLENKNTEPTKRNDKQLRQNEENQLKKEQEDQSNNHINR
jgi:YhcN/YlaJ family sporulation lipoprotein